MIKTYKILSLLLSYPTSELQEFLEEIGGELRDEKLLPEEAIKGIEEFTKYFSSQELTDWQAHYVQLFDYSRAASLHLFEHVQGDSKDRGQAMVDLISFYRENGLEIATHELPDHLPVFLEFLATLDTQRATTLLAEPINVIARIFEKLHEKNNMYQHVLSAILELPAKNPERETVNKIIRSQKPMDLDEEYEEKPVTFGGNNDCTNCH
ncbi:MAG: nitrate reductase molybdenum cofactor assembly chaperone [Bacteroidales bacterium]|nr:nitrate reductase molybdenum cofactor assembly chaperone [Bacteroidales bacterium]